MSQLWIKWRLSLHEASDEIWLHRYFFIITFSLKVFLVVTYIHTLHQYFLGYIIANWWIEWLASFQMYKKRPTWVVSCFLFLLLTRKSWMHHNGRNASTPHCILIVVSSGCSSLLAEWLLAFPNFGATPLHTADLTASLSSTKNADPTLPFWECMQPWGSKSQDFTPRYLITVISRN